MRKTLVALFAGVALLVGPIGPSVASPAPDQPAVSQNTPTTKDLPDPIPGQKSSIEGMPDIPALSSEQVAEGRKAAATVHAKVVEAKAKGWSGVAGTEDQIPPLPPGEAQAKKATCVSWPTDYCRHYLRGTQTFTDVARGVSAQITTNKPFVENTAGTCEHSLAEISAHNTASGNNDTVEVGWQVSPCRRADGVPILFAAAWDDGVFMGYDGDAGWVDNPAALPNLMAGVASPMNHTYKIDATSTHLWVGWQSVWVASLDKTAFTGTTGLADAADSLMRVQFFWELATKESDPCSDLGAGIDSNPVASGTGAITNITYVNTADAVNIGSVQRLNPGGPYVNDNRAAITETPANTLRGSGPMYGPSGGSTVGVYGC